MGTVGIVAGQVARLSLFHHADETINPCGFQLVLSGVDGKPLATYAGKVEPGKGAFADFVLGEDLETGERLQLHAHVELEGKDHPVGGTLEIFDAKTGVTAFGVVPGGLEETGMEMGTAGVAARQSVRVSLFHLDQGITPCGYRIVLRGLDGAALGTAEGSVLPGQGAFHDFALGAGLGPGKRVQFHADVFVAPHDAGTPPVGSFAEVFDLKSGETTMGITPCGLVDPSLGQG